MVYKIILLSIVVFFLGFFVSTLFRKLSDKRIDKEDSKKLIQIYQRNVV
jgi:septation ring formation regulator EzrA